LCFKAIVTFLKPRVIENHVIIIIIIIIIIIYAITFMNKKTANTFLVDTAVPNTHNLAKTITDKQNKYQELEH